MVTHTAAAVAVAERASSARVARRPMGGPGWRGRWRCAMGGRPRRAWKCQRRKSVVAQMWGAAAGGGGRRQGDGAGGGGRCGGDGELDDELEVLGRVRGEAADAVGDHGRAPTEAEEAAATGGAAGNRWADGDAGRAAEADSRRARRRRSRRRPRRRHGRGRGDGPRRGTGVDEAIGEGVGAALPGLPGVRGDGGVGAGAVPTVVAEVVAAAGGWRERRVRIAGRRRGRAMAALAGAAPERVADGTASGVDGGRRGRATVAIGRAREEQARARSPRPTWQAALDTRAQAAARPAAGAHLGGHRPLRTWPDGASCPRKRVHEARLETGPKLWRATTSAAIIESRRCAARV